MYPSSTSSSSHGSMGPPTSGTNNNGGGGGGGLMRYGSAPSTFLSTAVESVTGRPSREFSSLESNHHHHNNNRKYQPHNFSGQPTRFFPMENSSFASDQSSCKPSNNINNHSTTSNSTTTTTSCHNHSTGEQHRNGQSINTTIGLQRSSYGCLQQDATVGVAIGGSEMVSSTTDSTSPLVRHSSSPAGFLNHHAHAASSTNENVGFSITGGHGISRLNSQLSFTRQEPLSQISEENENAVNGLNRDHEQKKGSHSFATTSYGVGSWENGNSIMFSVGTSKRDKNIGNDIVNDISSMETQFQFSMPHTVIEMTTMDNLLNIPQDSVPCKIRAKRGCATHPRSIAERERRTRISGKLKKLQELVPNMDKQTSYADMLDLAVQHIKGLQNQVQKLNKELDHCKCGCRNTRKAGGEEKS